MTTTAIAIPSLQQLVEESDSTIKDNALMVILNQPPPASWIKYHPLAKIKDEKTGQDVPLPYLPIERVEYLLARIFTKWWVEVKETKIIANSVVVTVRLYVTNPITKEVEWNDGVGACPIQTNKGAGASDWEKVKANGVQLATPAAKTYAVKDAAEAWGKIFGKDLTRKEVISYDSLLKTQDDQITIEELRELYALKKDSLTIDECASAERILGSEEVKSYKKLHDLLKSK